MKKAAKFLPIFIFYFLCVIFWGENSLFDDEVRYFENAQDFLKYGFFTNPENPNVLNGPGYPLFLVPFVWLGLPPIIYKLFNAIFIGFSAYFVYKVLKLYIPEGRAMLFAYTIGLFYPLTRVVSYGITDCLTLFVVCAFLYTAINYIAFERFSWQRAVFPGFSLGYLVLTKVIFGYVVIVAIGLFGIWRLISGSEKSLKFTLVLIIGFLFSTPFLIHNYLLTGKHFSWGNNGGTQLYWMTSKKNNEYGTWFSRENVLQNSVPGMDPSHVALYQSLDTLNYIDRNDRFLEAAVENIKSNPKAYLSNIPPNALRLFFFYPNSYVEHNYLKLYYYLFASIFLLVPVGFSLYPAWLGRKNIPFEIIAMMIFISIYFGGTILVYAIPRYLIPVVPFFILWLGFVYTKIVKVTLQL